LLPSGLGALSFARIATDGLGDWVTVMWDSGGGKIEIHASTDDGETWKRIHLPIVMGHDAAALWYGGGRFWLFTCGGGAGNALCLTSLRGEE
jgi:hypothetical protein